METDTLHLELRRRLARVESIHYPGSEQDLGVMVEMQLATLVMTMTTSLPMLATAAMAMSTMLIAKAIASMILPLTSKHLILT